MKSVCSTLLQVTLSALVSVTLSTPAMARPNAEAPDVNGADASARRGTSASAQNMPVSDISPGSRIVFKQSILIHPGQTVIEIGSAWNTTPSGYGNRFTFNCAINLRNPAAGIRQISSGTVWILSRVELSNWDENYPLRLESAEANVNITCNGYGLFPNRTVGDLQQSLSPVATIIPNQTVTEYTR